MKLTKQMLTILVLGLSLNAHAWKTEKGKFSDWVAKLQPLPSVQEQIVRFWNDKSLGATPDDYVQHFPLAMKEKIFNELTDSHECKEELKVDFLNNITSNAPLTAKTFETNFLRVESTNCLGQLDLNKTFETYMSDDFNKKVIEGLKSLKTDQTTNQVCADISVPILGKSSYCITQHIWKSDNKIVIHAYNESNGNNVQVPIYFRESVTVFEKLASNQIVFYNLVYGRGPDLSLKSMIKSKITAQQKKLIDELMMSAAN